MKRTATAEWHGGIKDGNGTLSTETGTLSDTPYSFSARFESGSGTNPEELIAAAHAGCFTMALSGQLVEAGLKPQSLRTTATVTMDKGDKGFAITGVHLEVTAQIPGGDQQALNAAAGHAKANCLVSKILNTTITMDAKLEKAARR